MLLLWSGVFYFSVDTPAFSPSIRHVFDSFIFVFFVPKQSTQRLLLEAADRWAPDPVGGTPL